MLPGLAAAGQTASISKPAAQLIKDEDRQSGKGKKLAIIIDDLGNGMQGTEEIMTLPVKVTVAIMPFLPTTKVDARKAHEAGHDVLIHLPLEPKQGPTSWLGPGAILTKMSDDEIRKKVEAAIDNVPYAIGINNHMGSKVTGDERVMSIILDVCRERGLFFVDSRTNYRSVIFKLCEKKGMPQIKNDIFLDDVHTEAHISKQMDKVAEQVRTEGKCITIGHVGTKGKRTAAVLRKYIPKLQEQGIEFVGISEMVRDAKTPGQWPGGGIILP
ncbi:divergent polysaccharide deacetylase family protein [Paenibacillus woosongensis]|nr:divergent polysaccharide deacetylase family protein [Paenibacillus woosongensis]